ncbi:MAG: hypothetical protein F4X36_20730, partial [Gammaproteobacteria bacterium]|nr:hypothetical protein [Gammaproteobacteria bacterium]
MRGGADRRRARHAHRAGGGVLLPLARRASAHARSRAVAASVTGLSVRRDAVWTVAALLAVVAIAVPATRERLEREAAGGADLTIEVRASQWRWEYTYLDEMGERRFGFASVGATSDEAVTGLERKDDTYLRAVDRPLVIPAQRKVRLLVTSDDVVHAFWVPDLGIRADAVPGVRRTVWLIPNAPG